MTSAQDPFVERVERWLDEEGPDVAPQHLVEATVFAPRCQPNRVASVAAGTALGAAAVILIAAVASLLLRDPNVGPSPAPSISATCRGCLDSLPAGKPFISSNFQPVVSFVPGDDRWGLAIDEPARLRIEEIADPRRQVTIYLNPRAAQPAGGESEPGVGTTVDELAAWLAANPMVEAEAPRPASLGGLEGLRIELRGSPDLLTRSEACEEPGIPCASVFRVDIGSGPAEMGLLFGDVVSLYLLERGEDVVLVSVERIHGAPSEGFVEGVAPVLESLDFR